MKIHKNEVSYFLAGFAAGMYIGGEHDILDRMYRELELNNFARIILQAYDSKEFDTEGQEAMINFLKEKWIPKKK